ncbi:ThuA domain-containing protein [Cohnella zeiphila]|uniref:ThuA domain-containing protein n=1 Tax=Cohnella zeiphila TaxID=2761120 RepID=A0A7X0SNW1_9BACL|nr:ThuA domain-containing protein [Cohnella zeiphila]MBB6733468.1 ThuA domain-containing protein [Cohnella zeiphila]
MSDKLKAAVITEWHPVEMIPFQRLFREFEEFETYVQSLDIFCQDKDNEQYDVVVYYNLSIPTPEADDARRKYLEERLGRSGQGIVLLHHAILNYGEWPLWTDVAGVSDRSFKYYWEQTVRYDPTPADHPITRGLRPFAMIDETYTMAEPNPDNEILLTADHPNSMKAIAWTRQYKNSRVFCYQSGHDDFAYRDPNFQGLLRRGMLWCAGRLE